MYNLLQYIFNKIRVFSRVEKKRKLLNEKFNAIKNIKVKHDRVKEKTGCT